MKDVESQTIDFEKINVLFLDFNPNYNIHSSHFSFVIHHSKHFYLP